MGLCLVLFASILVCGDLVSSGTQHGEAVHSLSCSCPFLRKSDICLDRCRPSETQAITPEQDDLLLRLRGKRIAIFGDSLALQLARALQCYVWNANITIDHFSLCAFPVTELELERLIRSNLGHRDGYDAIMFSLGTWYSMAVDASVAECDIGPDVEMGSTMRMLLKCCPQSNILLKELQDSLNDNYSMSWLMRTRCRLLLGKASFVSGLQRLRHVIHANRHRWPAVFWKDIAPQHFPTPSGHFARQIGEPCVAIQNNTDAYLRNYFADDVLGVRGPVRYRSPSGDAIGDQPNPIEANFHSPSDNNGRHTINFIRTYQYDVTKWDLHLPGDCTHYCSPSDVTINWATSSLQAVDRQARGVPPTR